MNDTPIYLPLIISEQKGKPIVMLRRVINNPAIIKFLVNKALEKNEEDQQVVFVVRFTDKIKSRDTMMKKRIMYNDPYTGQDYFLI